MVQLAERRKNAVSVGCKLVNAEGTKLIEAGSIVFQDGSAAGYGRGERNPYADEYSYPRPVDYVSGACLLVEREVFMGNIHSDKSFGFDGQRFPNYYEDTDFQLHIQHNLKKEVWFQPRSIARHEEHGSFGKDESKQLMRRGRIAFLEKWRLELKTKHLAPPTQENRDEVLRRGADLRARNPNLANILYIDTRAPNVKMGAGFGRSFDNLSMIAELGHQVTLWTEERPALNNWCDDACVKRVTGLGIEYAKEMRLSELFKSRKGFYDVIIVSRPETLERLLSQLVKHYLVSPFAFIYDCEALSYRRNELLSKLGTESNIPFFGLKSRRYKSWESAREKELALISIPDIVVPVSEVEESAILKFSGGG